MSAYAISQWIQGTSLAAAIRGSRYAYPIILSTHLTCIAMFGGLVFLTDLRLLGWAMPDVPVALMIRQLRPWKWLGFTITVSCGLLLAISEMSVCYANPYFLAKLLLLALVGVHALCFRTLVYKTPEKIDAAAKLPPVAKLAGGLSLILWLSIPICGRMIAYYEPPAATTANGATLKMSSAVVAPKLRAPSQFANGGGNHSRRSSHRQSLVLANGVVRALGRACRKSRRTAAGRPV